MRLLFSGTSTALFALMTWMAADPVGPPLSPPAIQQLSPATTAHSPGVPLQLSPGRFRWFSVTPATGPITWEIDNEASVGVKGFAKATASFLWAEGSTDPDVADLPAESVVVWGRAPGQAKLTAYGVVDGRAKRLDTILLLVGPMPPPPPPPPPPGPVNPIPSDKLRVLIIYETGKTYTFAETGVMNSSLVREQIRIAGGDWRMWGHKDDASQEAEFWRLAMARGKGKALPYVIISSPKGFFEGAVPKTLAEFHTLVSSY